MLTSLLLSTLALAGEIRFKADPALISAHKSTWAVYAGDSYSGMVTMDGTSTDSGGATLVVRYLAAGQDKPAWLEGVTVDKAGTVVEVVRREGRRMRTLTVGEGQVVDIVREGQDPAPLSSRSHAIEGEAFSAWLLPVLLPGARAAAGGRWQGELVDAQALQVDPALLTATGKQEVGGGRKALVATLQPAAGGTLRYVYDAETVTAIIDAEAGVQWVSAPREQVKATHTK
jgi:hypothetical protein